MKKEYDFSTGERGKFFSPNAKLYQPIYIESELMEALEQLAQKQNVEIGAIVNEWLKRDIQTAKL